VTRLVVTRMIVGAAYVAGALAWFAAPAAAQRSVFIEGLAEFTAAVEGTFGDEGARVGPALDKMAGGLAEWDRALQSYETRLSSELPNASPHSAFEARLTLGRMYVERGRLADALRELDAAARLTRELACVDPAADVVADRNRPDSFPEPAPKASTQASCGVEPQRADPHVLRGVVLEALARPAEADEAYRTAFNLDQTDPVIAYHALRRRVLGSRPGDHQRALDVLSDTYRRLLRDNAREKASPFPTVGLLHDRSAPVLPPAAYAPGFARLSGGDYSDAIARFRNAAAIDPLVTDPASRSRPMMQAVTALRQGRLAEARSLVERSAMLEAGSSEAHRILGGIDTVDSRYDESVSHLEAAIRRNPRDERSRLALARVLSAAGRDDEAERALQETIRVLPDSTLARWWLGSSYERRNRFEDARRELALAAAGAAAGGHALYASIGQLAINAADVSGASEMLARSVRDNPNDTVAHRHLAAVLLQQDRADDAFSELVAALLIDPRDADAHAGIGQIHLNAGRDADAAAALRRALEIQQGHAEARYALATALARLGRTQESAQELERFDQQQQRMLADRRRNMTLDVLREEAALRAAEGAYDRAVTLWQQVIDQQPERSSDHVGLASALAGAGRIDAAIREYEAAAELDGAPDVYRQLAAVYAQAGRTEDSARARIMYDRALQGLPTSPRLRP
jgi:tetratricopeptide (TPR) repeat protein